MKYRKTFREALNDMDKKDKPEAKPEAPDEKPVEDKDAIIKKLQDEIQQLKLQAQLDKPAAEPHPDTGEVPLRTGIAAALLDKKGLGDEHIIANALKKANESRKYHDTKSGSLQDAVMQMQADETKVVTIRVKELSALIETYLAKGGVSRNLSPVIAEDKLNEVLPLQAVREFIDTYNRHFLTNFKAEEFIVRDRLNETQVPPKRERPTLDNRGPKVPKAPTPVLPTKYRNKGQRGAMSEDEIVAIRVKEFSSLVETYLLKGGVIDTTSIDEDVDLDEEINALPLHEVRDFITTYNKFFMTNYKAEEFILQVDEKVAAGAGIGGGEAKPSTLQQLAKKAKGIIGRLWKNYLSTSPIVPQRLKDKL